VKRIAHTWRRPRQAVHRPVRAFLTRLAFDSESDGGGNKEVYLMDMDSDNQLRLTYHKSLTLAPDFSNDASMIVYQSYLKGQPGLFVLPKEGGQTRQIPVTTTLNASPSFSPDSKLVAYCGSVRGNPEIFSVALDGSSQNRLTESSAIDSTPRFAPNGRELVFTSNRQGTPQIYTMDVDGTNVKKLTDYGNWNDEAAFSPDGSKVAHACRNDRQMQICITDRPARTFQITNSGMAGIRSGLRMDPCSRSSCSGAR
jgi:TolB protein